MGFWMGELFVVTANRTDDGSVVYLRADGAWTPRLDEAHALDDACERDRLVAWAAASQQREVADPYATVVRRDGCSVVPLSARERIRAAGPVPVLRQWGYAS